jgi:Zn-dependent protease with chaperone function
MNSERLKEFWKYFKVGFKGRLIVCTALIVSLSIFNSFINPYVKLASGIATLVTAELFVLLYFNFYWNNLVLVFKGRKSVEVPLPDELVKLSKEMGLKLTKMKILPEICNAYVRGKQLFMGETLLEKLDSDEVKAVVAHEFGHIKGRHLFVQIVYIFPILACVTLSWSHLPFGMLEIGLFAYMMVALIPIQWRFERRADFAAVKQVGKEPLKSALLKLIGQDFLDIASESHPAASQRIKWIDECN